MAQDGRERAADGGSLPRSTMRRGVKASGWVVPGAMMVLMPKCPACVVAYVAIVSGVGISVPMAAHLRMIVLVVCGVALLFLMARLLLRRVGASS
jgi:hypothetical protein